MTLQLTRRRFTVHEYYQMAQAGILTEDDRVELIKGEIIQMPPIGPPHNARVTWLNWLFNRAFGDVAFVQPQGPVRLSDDSEPQPDLALIRRRPGYTAGHPTPDDVFLIVEVGTTVQYDREVKALLYARSGIPEYWLFDVNQETITVYRDPTPEGYPTVQVLRRGDRIAPLAFPDWELVGDDLLGEE